jgi:hypothetical protein
MEPRAGRRGGCGGPIGLLMKSPRMSVLDSEVAITFVEWIFWAKVSGVTDY